VPLAVLLFRWRRDGRPDAVVLGVYRASAGAIRFVIEFVRVNVRVLGPFAVAHVAMLAVVATGVTLVVRSTGHARSSLRV
jgi:prolipoprotein diacylglyceryltransferase